MTASLVLMLAGCRPAARPPSAEAPSPGAAAAAAAAGDSARAPAVVDVGEPSPTGSFAYVHADGRQLLALDSLFPPQAVRWAICPGGAVLPVRHAGRQLAKPGGTGRQRATNFDHEEGERYTVTAGAAPPDASCYLTADAALVAALLTPATAVPSTCAAILRRRLEEAEQRAVLRCWPLAAFAPGVTVAVAEMAPVGNEALGVMAVADGDTLRLDRYPATLGRPGQDLWRVDDGGIFRPDGFRVLFAARRDGEAVVAVSWMGAEGENLYLLAPGRDPRGEPPAPDADFGRWHRGYRYLAPE
ncbi:MAG: hypothetical protein KJT01_04205 [Gemmatimonadetes bacterium]|nr:hypothetical protein [Gemmatimonadota bacterium]